MSESRLIGIAASHAVDKPHSMRALNQQRSSLLRLPTEPRNYIVELVLVEDKIVTPENCSNRGCHFTLDRSSLLHTSQQLREEAGPIWYGQDMVASALIASIFSFYEFMLSD